MQQLQQTDYKLLLIDVIKQFFVQYLPNGWYNKIYIGDPLDLPQISTPCIILEKTKSTVTLDGTGADQMISDVTIRVVINKKDELGKDPNEVPGHRTLQYLAEGIDVVTGQYHENSIMGVLRNHFTLEPADIGNAKSQFILDAEHTIQYQLSTRGQDTIYQEAVINVVMTQRFFVPNRN